MVQEYRRIILSTEELVMALEAYQKITPGFLPEGRIARCAIHEYGVIKITMESGENENVKQAHLTFKASDILRPVIGFCIEHKIMLPKGGQKSIEVQKDSVVLRIELNLNINPRDPKTTGEGGVKHTPTAAAVDSPSTG